jgi:hypothetical protein
MPRIPGIRFSIRTIMVVVAITGAVFGLYLRTSRPIGLPGMNANDVGPDRVDPFPGRSYEEVVRAVNESPSYGVP